MSIIGEKTSSVFTMSYLTPPLLSPPPPPRIPVMQQTGEQFANVLVRETSAPDRSKVNLAALQQDLSIEMNGDFYVVLAFTEKMKTDVL